MSKENIVKSGLGMDSNQILTGKGITFAQCERKRHQHEKLQRDKEVRVAEERVN